VTDFLELAERCETAPGPDRELDLAIINGITSKPGWFWHDKIAGIISRDDYGANALGNPLCSLEDYTSSIDAAITLVPEGYAIDGFMIWPGHPSTLTVLGTMRREFGLDRTIEWTHTGGDGKWKTQAATPALALCAAALRARAATPAQSSKGE